MFRVFLCALVAAAAAREYTDEELHRLPRMYHLDSYERCLAPPDGLYCTGTFRLSGDKHNAQYDFIKEYSSEPRNFDRTFLHRGYCLSTRCPSSEANTTLRFERCVEKYALSGGLRASLQTMSCKTRDQVKNDTMDTPQRVFLGFLGVLLVFNVVGTLYDFATGGQGKSKLLMAWSIRANSARLVATHEDGDPRLSALAPIQGVRALLLAVVVLTHAGQLSHRMFLYNPDFFEWLLSHPVTALVRNGSALIQTFILVSNFLFAYSLLLYSKNKKLGLAQLPVCIIYRFVRLTPVHLFVVGYAATWWRQAGEGPQWEHGVGVESDICRKKFWSHAFFLHNFFDNQEHCMLPAWFLAVDTQVYVVAAVVTLYLMQSKVKPVPVLAGLFVLSTLVNAVLAYVYEWKSMLYIMNPENIRVTFRGVPSFNQFYTSPWSSLPTCFLGLLVAHLHYDMQERGYKITKHELLVWFYRLTVPLHMAWVMVGNQILKYTSREAIAAYAATERPSFALLAALTLFGAANNIDDWFRRITSWRIWATVGRMSLSIIMLHWMINLHILSSLHTLKDASFFSLGGDMLTTVVCTMVLGYPLTTMVELPIQRSFSAIFT